jgi:uncharacterized membrane protein
VIVALVPVPVVITPSGVLVTVQVPDDGKPLNTTLPVATLQVGWVMIPTVGADVVAGCASITTSDDDSEIHVAALVTVNV